LTRRRSDFQAPPSDRRIRILAVDDDQNYLSYLQTTLRRAGFEVHVASDGPNAIERLRDCDDVDILLIDLTMPAMDGIETVRRVQEEASCLPGIYTILLTAEDAIDTKLRALDGGLDDFLSKQATESEIVAKLRSAARRLEMERRLQILNEELQTLALTDELTGIANRRALFRAAEQVLEEGRRLSVVLFDLDRFKHINDTYGHLSGDRILADVAATFRELTRVEDLIARYGGDEFVLLLPDTDTEEADVIASRLAARISSLHWTIREMAVTVSATWGTATAGMASSITTLLSECDARLYERKVGRGSKGNHTAQVVDWAG
jgi:diguanylate cyclase (GGDEF)-like protein